jgi:uncharacterized membrane protein YbhN (UPF0104 family)
MIVCAIGNTVSSIPLGIPAEVGLPEIVMLNFYILLGVPFNISAADAAAAIVLMRIVTLWFKILVGYLAIQWSGIKVLRGNQKLTS